MSINHFSIAVPESFWRPQAIHYDPLIGKPPKCQVTGFDFNLNDHGSDYDKSLPDDREVNKLAMDSGNSNYREPLFEKPLTPSDVGKLNRLVIPKQHAERCFPLGRLGFTGADSGMLLSFEDEYGKFWRFRYSYWSSSQSYVLTKGWSRYVKEKMLDAGDVVFFERHRINGDRLFIGWRRRVSVTAEPMNVPRGWIGAVGGNGYRDSCIDQDQGLNHAGGSGVAIRGTASTPSGSSKRFRLFGVNLEYCQQPDDDDDLTDGSQRYEYSDTYHGNLHNYMDVDQVGN